MSHSTLPEQLPLFDFVNDNQAEFLISNAVTGKIDVRHIPIPMEKAA